ncbi:hypothetical protein BZ160_12325 [Pantoea vagans]|nr:hypothetical protein BZ160_12325 [Pantoea vagans]
MDASYDQKTEVTRFEIDRLSFLMRFWFVRSTLALRAISLAPGCDQAGSEDQHQAYQHLFAAVNTDDAGQVAQDGRRVFPGRASGQAVDPFYLPPRLHTHRQ